MEGMQEVKVFAHDYELESKMLLNTFRKILKNQRWKRPSDMIKKKYGYGKHNSLQNCCP